MIPRLTGNPRQNENGVALLKTRNLMLTVTRMVNQPSRVRRRGVADLRSKLD